jgi:hypothetical protein
MSSNDDRHATCEITAADLVPFDEQFAAAELIPPESFDDDADPVTPTTPLN